MLESYGGLGRNGFKKKKKACHCLLPPLLPAIESVLCTQTGERANAPALSVFGVTFKKYLVAVT